MSDDITGQLWMHFLHNIHVSQHVINISIESVDMNSISLALSMANCLHKCHSHSNISNFIFYCNAFLILRISLGAPRLLYTRLCYKQRAT